MTITHAAERLGITRAFLSRILHGHAGITAATALRLEALGWSDAEHWMRMQASHDLARERRHAVAVPHHLGPPGGAPAARSSAYVAGSAAGSPLRPRLSSQPR